MSDHKTAPYIPGSSRKFARAVVPTPLPPPAKFQGPTGCLFHQLLPYPPSVNDVWKIKQGGGGIYLSEKGQAYRRSVINTVNLHRSNLKLTQNLSLTLWVYPPDRRRRDVDNIFKSLLDAMQHAQVYDNDSQIKSIRVDMSEKVVKGGCVIVSLFEHCADPEPDVNALMIKSCSLLVSAYPES